mgnify:CR=1 FL=1
MSFKAALIAPLWISLAASVATLHRVLFEERESCGVLQDWPFLVVAPRSSPPTASPFARLLAEGDFLQRSIKVDDLECAVVVVDRCLKRALAFDIDRFRLPAVKISSKGCGQFAGRGG